MSRRFGPLMVLVLFGAVLAAGFAYVKLKKPAAQRVEGFPSDKFIAFRDAVDTAALERLAVLGRGRFQPADTTARSALRTLTDSRWHNPEHAAYTQPDGQSVKENPAFTLFCLALAPQHYLDAPLFSIVSDPLRRILFAHHWQGLGEDKAAEADALKRAWLDAGRSFTCRELYTELVAAYERHTAAIAKSDAAAAGLPDAAPRDLEPRRHTAVRFKEQLARLAELNSKQRQTLAEELVADLREALAAGMLPADAAGRHPQYVKQHMDELEHKLGLFANMSGAMRIVPTSTDEFKDWISPEGLLIVLNRDGRGPMQMQSFAPETADLPEKFVLTEGLEELDEQGLRAFMGKWKALRAAFADLDARRANALIAEIAQIVSDSHPTIKLGAGGRPLHYPSLRQMDLEVAYNGLHKFVWSWYFFAMAAVLLLGAVSFRSTLLLTPGLGLFALGFLAMSASFVFRLLLANRGSAFAIPIANQFESLVWAMFFGTVIGTAMVLWSRSWNAVGALVGVSILGVLVMGVSYFKPMGVASEVEPEVPVLRAALLPFHVGSMVGGYAIIALAFGMALCYLGMWFRTGSGAEDRLELAQADLFQARIVKGVFFLLLVGLILGAAWGDVAWGRWWGWDPKETWAFITWLVYAIVIHIRLITRDRGVVTAVMSAWGFGIMLFTWFGTNYGVTRGGLHAYSGTPADEAGNVIPLIWAGMTAIFPITGSFLPGGLALGAYAVSAARKRAESPVPRILNMAAVCAVGFTIAVFIGLYWRYGATPAAMWDWVCRSARTPIDATHVLTTLEPETAGAVLNPMLLGLWLLVHATLSLVWGSAITALSRKAPAS